MTERDETERAAGPRGCLAAGAGATALALLSPFVVAVRGWRAWRRGTEVRSTLDVTSVTPPVGPERRRFDLSVDVPSAAEPGFRRRLTVTVIRVAELLRRADDVYHLVYRLPWDEESTAIPVGPRLQELGERFSLVQSQGAMIGRTAVWLTLGRDRALAEVVDPGAYDPEIDSEPDGLLVHPDVHWSMATAWARAGPSLAVRVILVVPEGSASRVATLVELLDESLSPEGRG
jgi:hypothetical protein